jgi:hypothetical protein
VGARKEKTALTASYATAKADSVAIVDPAVKDWEFLRAGVVAGAEVIVLDPGFFEKPGFSDLNYLSPLDETG